MQTIIKVNKLMLYMIVNYDFDKQIDATTLQEMNIPTMPPTSNSADRSAASF